MTLINLTTEFRAAKDVSKNGITVYYTVNNKGDMVSGVYEYWSEYIASLKHEFSREDIFKIKSLK